jgi:hypothetical protein
MPCVLFRGPAGAVKPTLPMTSGGSPLYGQAETHGTIEHFIANEPWLSDGLLLGTSVDTQSRHRKVVGRSSSIKPVRCGGHKAPPVPFSCISGLEVVHVYFQEMEKSKYLATLPFIKRTK